MISFQVTVLTDLSPQDLENQGALLEQQAMSSGRQRALIDEQKNLLTALQVGEKVQRTQPPQLAVKVEAETSHFSSSNPPPAPPSCSFCI